MEGLAQLKRLSLRVQPGTVWRGCVSRIAYEVVKKDGGWVCFKRWDQDDARVHRMDVKGFAASFPIEVATETQPCPQ